MLLHLLSVLCFALAHGVTEDVPELEWPTEYSLEATRISLTSGIIEDYKEWKTNSSSRIDYNKGAVKTIIVGAVDEDSSSIKYEIHPQTTDGDSNKLTCKQEKVDENKQAQEILPSTFGNNYQEIGYENINFEETVKFFYQFTDLYKDARHTLWAKYDEERKTWIPVRYEKIQYNNWLGTLSEHDIWDYYNFDVKVDESVFNIKDYPCKESSPAEVTAVKKLTMIDPENDEHVNHIFKTFQTKFNRKYTHPKEYARRRTIFKDKLSLILSTNRQNLGYKLTINKFADRTAEEMERYQGLKKRPEGKAGTVPFPYTEDQIKDIVADLPPEYDLRNEGLVSTIKNQESCACSWSMGTTAAMEGALARINGGRLIALSNQALIDCAWSFGASGCDGGNETTAYEWMMKYGLPTEAEYGPYLNRDGFCQIHNMTKIYPIRGYTDVTPYSIGALKVALINHGPLSVSVHVSDAFQLYSGGIFYDIECYPYARKHVVTLVGYGERDGETFWILKNSWGTSWGVDGYMFISSRDNVCGVASEPRYVIL